MDDWEAEDFQPLPAKVFGLKKSVDMLIPKSESDFLDYAELISQRLVPFEKSFHYIGLLKAVMRLSLANMKAADVKDVASSITAIANEKLKAEKEAAAGKKKSDVMERGSENNNHNTKPSPTPRLRYREISTGENSGDIDIPTDLAFTKPICEKRTGTIGGLGVWKLNTKVEESYEARKKFSNAKSISSSQFFGDQNKASDLELEFTLEKLSNDFSSLVGKTKERLGTLGSVITGLKKGIFPRKPGNPDDIKALRRDVTDLMQKLRSEDAHAIPWDIRMKWVEKVCAQLVEVTLGVDLAGGLGPTVYTLREDAWNLSEQLIIERDRERASREREFKLV